MEILFKLCYDVDKIKDVEHIHMSNKLELDNYAEFVLKQFAGLNTITLVMDPQPTKDADGMWHWKECKWLDEETGFSTSGINRYAPYKCNGALNISCMKVTRFRGTWVWLFEVKHGYQEIHKKK